MKSAKLKKNKFIILLILLAILLTVIKLCVWDNPKVLFRIAEGLDEPSSSFYLVLERIYKLSVEGSLAKRIEEHLSKNENAYLYDKYIRVLGVLGRKQSLYELKNIYNKYQHDQNYYSTLYYVISSMGLVGDNEIAFFLEALLDRYKQLNVQVPGATIAASLYLITGSTDYYFVNSSNKLQKIILTKELINARKTIISSKGRSRTYEEMLILDKIFRRPSNLP
jgi:hypothetical protein